MTDAPINQGDPAVTPPAKVDSSDRAKMLLDSLWSDKTLGANVRKKAKELFPDIVTPEDAAEPIVAPLKAQIEALQEQNKSILDRVAAREKADADATAEVELSKRLANARAAYGLTEDGFDKMVARMKETGNFTDADAAAAWVVQHSPKPQVANSPSWLPKSANLFGSKDKVDDAKFEKLHTDPQAYMDDELREFASDPDKYVAETFGSA